MEVSVKERTHPAIAKLLAKGTKPRVCIVGGGWNGLYALKWFVEEGLDDVVLFEQTNSIGGVWVYTPDKPGTLTHHAIHTHTSPRVAQRLEADTTAMA
jgi:cation diffusion facilitator CzcD-associated flavoprotein CzcO